MFVCSSRRVRDEILAADAPRGRDFSLRFSPWNRQLQAMHCKLRYRVHFELQGVPAHAWSRSTAEAVLSPDAWVECIGASTAKREDLGLFKVVGWTDDPSVFPKDVDILIEEPDDLMEEDEGLVLPSSALIPLEKTMLRYRVSVRVAHAEDMIPPAADDDDGGRGDGGFGGGDRGPGWSSRGSGHQSDRGSGDRRGEDRDPFMRDTFRRRAGGGWGGSRRVAINTAAQVSPWPVLVPEVEDDGAAYVESGRCPERLSAESGQDLHASQVVAGPSPSLLFGAMPLANPPSPRVSFGLVGPDIPGGSGSGPILSFGATPAAARS
jgi:hypothetical protein